MPQCLHPRCFYPQDELLIAGEEMVMGSWEHALDHYFLALVLDCFNDEALTAIRALHRPHDLIARHASDRNFGAAMARAHLLADRGDHEAAAEIMGSLDHIAPNLAATRLLAVGRLMEALQLGAGLVHFHAGERAAMAPYAALAEKIAATSTEPTVVAMAAGAIRCAGNRPRDRADRTACATR